MKVLFLDIDGVIQLFTQYRFDHEPDEVNELCRELTKKFHGVFDYSAWTVDTGGVNYCTFSAAVWDWNKEKIEQLKRVLEVTGAKIVLSSSWRDNGFDAMAALFRIWGLDKFYIDNIIDEYFWDSRHEMKMALSDRYEEFLGKDGFFNPRVFEILEWLDRHPEVRSYAAVDDSDLRRGLEGHYVHTNPNKGLTKEVADELISILGKEVAPFSFPKEILEAPELAAIRSGKAPETDD